MIPNALLHILLVFSLGIPTASAIEDADTIIEEARELRSDGELDAAAELLDEAMETIEPDHPRFQTMHLERNYHLRMARIRQQLNDGDIEGARATHTEVQQFLRGHPQRSRFMDSVDRYDLVIRGRERS